MKYLVDLAGPGSSNEGNAAWNEEETRVETIDMHGTMPEKSSSSSSIGSGSPSQPLAHLLQSVVISESSSPPLANQEPSNIDIMMAFWAACPTRFKDGAIEHLGKPKLIPGKIDQYIPTTSTYQLQ
ncbi:MAG: hypothetical protein MMC33_000051 [Icmadophila ericetorum]|nr:hypothetical protein [Icmadophila ericetorum]